MAVAYDTTAAYEPTPAEWAKHLERRRQNHRCYLTTIANYDIMGRIKRRLLLENLERIASNPRGKEDLALSLLVFMADEAGYVPHATWLVARFCHLSASRSRAIVASLAKKGLIWRPKSNSPADKRGVFVYLPDSESLAAEKRLFGVRGKKKPRKYSAFIMQSLHSIIRNARARGPVPASCARDLATPVADLLPAKVVGQPSRTSRARYRSPRLRPFQNTGEEIRRVLTGDVYMPSGIPAGMESGAAMKVDWKKIVPELQPALKDLRQVRPSGSRAELEGKARLLAIMYAERRRRIQPAWENWDSLMPTMMTMVRLLQAKGLPCMEEWPAYLDFLFAQVAWKGIAPPPKNLTCAALVDLYRGGTPGIRFRFDVKKAELLVLEKFPLADGFLDLILGAALRRTRGELGSIGFSDYPADPVNYPDYVPTPLPVRQAVFDAADWLTARVLEIGFRRVVEGE